MGFKAFDKFAERRARCFQHPANLDDSFPVRIKLFMHRRWRASGHRDVITTIQLLPPPIRVPAPSLQRYPCDPNRSVADTMRVIEPRTGRAPQNPTLLSPPQGLTT